MEAHPLKERALELLHHEYEKALGEPPVTGTDFAPRPPATNQQLSQLEERVGVPIPPDLREFLLAHDGAPYLGPGGVFGIGGEDHRTIGSLLEMEPTWVELGWFPVASDGCGNYYLRVANYHGCSGVVFVESIRGMDRVEYVAASDIFHFIVGILEKDVADDDGVDTYGIDGYSFDHWWPFDETATLEFDPALACWPESLLPWGTKE